MVSEEPNTTQRRQQDENRQSLHEELYLQKGYSKAEVEILLKLERMETKMESFEEAKKSYIRREEFEPIKQIVYGMVGIILIGFIGAVIALVIR
ncbi:MAG: hypothetical protein WA061_02345 [Microgenomates group bacterium]